MKEGAKKSRAKVLTQKEIAEEGKVPPSAKKRKTEKSPIQAAKNVEVKFECPWAPPGNSNVAFLHTWQGKEYKYEIKLKNKIYTLPMKNPVEPVLKKGAKKEYEKLLEKYQKDLEEITRYRAALRDNGFVDVTVIKAGAIPDKVTGKVIYSVVHPEHSPPKNIINGSISLVLLDDNDKPLYDKDGKQITEQVNIVQGMVKTGDSRIYEALLKAGFYSAGTQKVKEGA